MSKKQPTTKRKTLLSELFIHGEVESWHVLMVAHHQSKEVPRERAQYEEHKPDGECLYTRHVVSDPLSLEQSLLLRESIRGDGRLEFHITEWDAKDNGGIAGELSYDKESGLRGGVHISGSFLRDLCALLLSGSRVALGIQTKNGFYRRSAWVTSLAFSDIEHPQWLDEDCV